MSRRMRRVHQRVHPRLRAATVIARSVPGATDTLLDAETLDAYSVALEFQQFAAALMPGGAPSALKDQLARASAAILSNLAEGADRFAPVDKERHYAIARGSATECAAAVDVLRVRRLIAPEAAGHARSLIVRIVRMLTRLGRRFGSRSVPRWSAARRRTGHPYGH